MLLQDRNGGRFRKGWLVDRKRVWQHTGCPYRFAFLRRSRLERSLQWPHLTGVCVKIANGGRLTQGQISRTTRWAYASKKSSSHSVYASRVIVVAITISLARRLMPQGQVLPLRLQSHNAEVVRGRQIPDGRQWSIKLDVISRLARIAYNERCGVQIITWWRVSSLCSIHAATAPSLPPRRSAANRRCSGLRSKTLAAETECTPPPLAA